jgi:hypothetical protein
LSVTKNDLSVCRAGEYTRRTFRILFGNGKVGPAKDGTVGIGRIGGGELHEFRLLGAWFVAQLAKQIDGRGQSELRGTEAGDKVTAANAAALLNRFQHRVDGAESAGYVLGCDGLAGEDAVTVEQLHGQGMTCFCGRRTFVR